MRTLIVEDDPIIRRILRRFLEPFGECEEAATGPAAVVSFKAALEANQPFNLVCLDIQLPGWFGFEVLTELRSLEQFFQVTRHRCSRVIIATGNSETHSVQRTSHLSDAYMLKPIDKDALYERLINLGLVRESAIPGYMAREVVKACAQDRLSDEELGLLLTNAQSSLARLRRSRVSTI